MYLFLIILCLFFDFSNSKEFCSDDGKSLSKYLENSIESVALRKCKNYYNFKQKRCVAEDQYYYSGTCGNIYADPFEAIFAECRNFPHLTDCTKYYKCFGAKSKKVFCKGETLVNTTTMECDAQKCTYYPVGGLCYLENIGKRIYVGECTFYYECTLRHELIQCPRGWSYNLNTTKCDLKISDNPYCDQEDLADIHCSVEGFYGLKFDPTLYYVCSFEEKDDGNFTPKVVLRQCLLGAVFNSTTQSCQ